VIERILAIARYLHQLNQHLYTRNRYDRETLARKEAQLEAARNDARQLRAMERERPDATPDDECAEQLREVIGELQDATTDLRIERSRTSRLGLELETKASDGPLCGSSWTSAPRGYPMALPPHLRRRARYSQSWSESVGLPHRTMTVTSIFVRCSVSFRTQLPI